VFATHAANLHKYCPPNKAKRVPNGLAPVGAAPAVASCKLQLMLLLLSCLAPQQHGTINFKFAMKLVSEHVHLGGPHSPSSPLLLFWVKIFLCLRLSQRH